MKRNDLAEIKKMDIEPLLERVEKIRSEITDLVINKNIGKLPNLKGMFFKRKELAKILTVLKQKKLLKELEVKNG